MSVSDVCSVDVQALYLEDPGNKKDIAGYVLCSEMGNTCVKNGCSCRSAESAVVNGSTTYFAVCVVLKNGADCVTSGDDYVTCATDSSSGSAASSEPEAQNESSVAAISTTNTKATTESKSVASTSASGSGSVDIVSVSSNAASAATMSTTVMIVIIVVAVVFVALVSWVVRTYCMGRSAKQSKLSSRRNRSINFDATSPTNLTGRTSATPSFPAFDRRTRAMQSPTAGGRGRGEPRGANTPRGRGNPDMPRGRNTPRGRDAGNREPNSGRGRRNPDLDFGRVRSEREPASGRGRRKPEVELGRIRSDREPTSGRGRKNPDLEFGARGRGDREPTSGRGRRNPDMPNGAHAGMQREPNSGRGRRNPDMPRGKYQVEPPMRPDRTPPRDQRVKQHVTPRLPAARPAPEPPGGTVFTGRNTYERVAQFAQLAAFEAPPPPPPRPQRPIQPVKVADAIPKHARGPAPNAKPARPAPPKRPGFYIPEDPAALDYASMSPKTSRSLAPSVASSATTIVAQGRNRPTPLQQGRRQQYSAPAPPRFQSNSLDDSGFESKFESKFEASGNYDDSFVSEVSSMAWSGASGLSDESYYQAAPSNTARIPVIDAPNDDDEGSEADNYSDWGQSTQASEAFRSTAASDASFFSVNSDFTDTQTTAFKEREF
ncbi:hypothetical protein PRIC1_009992 [Phytophthora ramorum]